MKFIRTTVAGVTLAIAVPAMLVACGSQPAGPAAGPSPSSTPSATATASPPPTPAPTQAPGSTSPAPSVGYPWMTDFAQAGDFEGVLTYGIGVTRPVLQSNPQTLVRAYEVETVTPAGQHRYVVAVDIDAGHHV